MKHLLWRILRTTLITTLLLLLLLTTTLFFLQRNIIFLKRPNVSSLTHRIESSPNGKNIPFQTPDGTQHAFYFSRTHTPTHLWLIFAGQGGISLDWFNYLQKLPTNQALVFIDFPGLAKNQGNPSLQSLKRTLNALPQALQNTLPQHLNTSRENWRVYGNSLGSASALIAADQLHIPQGILLCPFTQLSTMAERVTHLPIGFLIRDRFDNEQSIRQLAQHGAKHFYIFHGQKDELIPLAHSQKLQTIAPNLITLYPIPNAQHNDIPQHANQQLFSTLLKLCQ